MDQPRWLTRALVDAIHSEMIAEHGGASGTRSGGSELIDSALDRPRNRLAYEPESDIAAFAASYLLGLVKNHGYIDGNKRVAFAAAATFLLVNGVRLTATEIDAYNVVMATADGSLNESQVADWIRASSEPAY